MTTSVFPDLPAAFSVTSIKNCTKSSARYHFVFLQKYLVAKKDFKVSQVMHVCSFQRFLYIIQVFFFNSPECAKKSKSLMAKNKTNAMHCRERK